MTAIELRVLEKFRRLPAPDRQVISRLISRLIGESKSKRPADGRGDGA